MFPPFPQDEAYKECLTMLSDLQSGRLVLRRISRESEERKTVKVMLGVLIADDEAGARRILKTVSGNAFILECKTTLKNEVFVLPVVSSEKINEALSKNDREIHELTEKINALEKSGGSNNKAAHAERNAEPAKTERALCGGSENDAEKKIILSEQRKKLTTESLLKVHDLYSFMCSDNKMRSLKSICTAGGKSFLPPTGTGDCCAPKLFHYAFLNKMQPVSLCEVFYDETKQSAALEDSHEAVSAPACEPSADVSMKAAVSNKCVEIKKYAPCDERCALILPSILGLEILYRDESIIVVNKQSGVLSVPGRGPEKRDSISYRVRKLFPFCIEQPAVHRLDMETSGLMVLAFTKEAHKNLNAQFENRVVKKEYIALIDGVLPKKNISKEGQCELYFRLDPENRPHQIWDEVYGKKAVTEWKILDVENYTSPEGLIRPVTRVLFIPHTGRTHQLRLAASDRHGFGTPIIGDTLYGKCESGERLCLHAGYLSFVHPVTGKTMEFKNESPF